MWSYEQTLSDMDFFVGSYGITLILKQPTIIHHHQAAGQGKYIAATFDQLTKSQHEVLG
jgi:hypothetical protein